MEKKDTKKIVLKTKIEEVKNKTLHKNWLGWYERRKGINENLRQIYSKQMLNGLVEDFYSVCESQNTEIETLKQENEKLRGELQAERENNVENRNQNNVISNWLVEYKKENTKLKERAKELEMVEIEMIRRIELLTK